MAAPKLSQPQRMIVLQMVAADYSIPVMLERLGKLKADGTIFRQIETEDNPALFPALSESALKYYRTKYAADIATLRTERRTKAIVGGLALKAERVARLCEHADELELRKWEVSLNGRMWNEKAWRETLDDIAREMGERRSVADDSGNDEIVKIYVGIDYDKV